MKKIITALCIGFFLSVLINSYFETTEAALAKSVIRFHVIANSDSDADQKLKLKVRDRIIEETEGLFNVDEDIDVARETIEKNMGVIQKIAEDEIQKNGYSYCAEVSLGKSDFPTKEYGSLVLPAGSYEALKIKIGNAEGHNWWCVLFPPLCFVDETCVSGDTKAVREIEDNLSGEDAKLVMRKKSPEVEFRFKAYEIWQSGKQKLAYLFK